MRRSLTHFENSRLAARFSGRWDDSLERDKEGNFFIDEDPQVFLPLLNHLRQCDQKTRNEMMIEPPTPTHQFCNMLEYYGLMLCVYPQYWRQEWGKDDGVVNDDSYTISSTNTVSAFGFYADIPLNAASFTAVFDEDCIAQIGWAEDLGDGKKVGYDEKFNSFAFDLHESEFMANRVRIGNGRDWNRKYPVTIHFTRNPMSKTCSMHVLDKKKDKEMLPHISLRGKVTISSVEDALCEKQN